MCKFPSSLASVCQVNILLNIITDIKQNINIHQYSIYRNYYILYLLYYQATLGTVQYVHWHLFGKNERAKGNFLK